MPRDYPDWMQGFETQEGARRMIYGIGAAETGQVLWASSFEDGLAEWIIDAPDAALVVLRGDDAYRGGVSVRITTDGTLNDVVSLLQFVRPLKTGRLGIEIMLKPMTFALSGNMTTRIVMYVSNPAWTSGYLSCELEVRNDGTTHGAVWVLGGLGSFQDTGIRLPSFYINEGLGYYLLSWHQFKIVADFDDHDPLFMGYVRLVYDGKDYDLSSYKSIRGDPVEETYGIAAGVRVRADEAVVKSMNVDSMVITYDEP